MAQPTNRKGQKQPKASARSNGHRPESVPPWEDPFGEELDEELASWIPVDLGPALRGEKSRPEPNVFKREDGRGLFYRGQVNYLFATDSVGKSIIALMVALDEMHAERNVVWIDFEDPDETTIAGRLKEFGCSDALAKDRFRYLNPQMPASEAAVDLTVQIIEHYGAGLVVIDSIGEAFSLEGLDEDKDAHVGPWLRRVPRRLANAGPAVLVIDHSTKANDNPLFPSGSKRKRAAVTGSGFYVKQIQSLDREHGKGRLQLMTSKDRHGYYVRGQPAAEIVVERLNGVHLEYWVKLPLEAKADGVPDKRLIKDIAVYLQTYDGAVQRNIETGVVGNAGAIRAALLHMDQADLIKIETKGRSHHHWLTDKGRKYR